MEHHLKNKAATWYKVDCNPVIFFFFLKKKGAKKGRLHYCVMAISNLILISRFLYFFPENFSSSLF